MVEQIVYRQISVDTAHIPPGGRADATFFEVSSPPLVDGSTRVTDLEEKPIVRWLMLDPLWRQLIWNELGLPSNAFYQPEVVQPFFAPGEAEFDLVACDPCRPDRALVIECKRVKVEILNEEQDRITKLHDVARGVSQANNRCVSQANNRYSGRYAFSRTFLAIVTAVSAADQDESNVPNRGVRSYSLPARGDVRTTTFRQLVEFPGREKLHDDIGILFIEVAQPSRLSIDTQVNVRVCVYRNAVEREQHSSVTNRMKELMRSR